MDNTLEGVKPEVVEPTETGGSVRAEEGRTGAVAARKVSAAEKTALGDLVRHSRATGVALTGPDRLEVFTKAVLAWHVCLTERTVTGNSVHRGLRGLRRLNAMHASWPSCPHGRAAVVGPRSRSLARRTTAVVTNGRYF